MSSGSVRERPRFRGRSHQIAFFLSLAAGGVLVAAADGSRQRLAAIVFAASVASMFGASALYHRVLWTPARRRWMARLDHGAIYLLIAGTYTPFGLIVLSGTWRVAVLAVVWSGAGAAICLKLAWVSAPKWLAAAMGVALGWVGIAAFPQMLDRIDPAGTALLVGGGACYTIGSIVYALRRPDPVPAVFGYHEVFHALVVVAVALQYVSIGFFVLPLELS